MLSVYNHPTRFLCSLLMMIFLGISCPAFTSPVRAEATATPLPQTTPANDETTLTLESDQFTDVDTLIQELDQQPALRQVDMYDAELSAAQMDILSTRYPNISFGWTLHIGDHTLRTDATAFSTLHSRNSTPHTNEDFAVLRYCHNLLALDIGHNAVTDISFLESLPKLKILILGRNQIADTTPLGTLTDLEYLELFSDGVDDISALANCTHLMDVNLTNNHIADLTPILSLPNLKRLWLYRSTGVLSGDRFSKDVKQTIIASVPSDCEVNFTSSGTGGGWRDHARYDTIFLIFQSGVYQPWD